MIEDFDFNNDNFKKAFVTTDIPDNVSNIANTISFVRGQCMGNSYQLADKSGCKMIEGYLITEYHSKKDFDVVAHVWNAIEDKEFDVSANLITDPDVKELSYYPLKYYVSKNALIQPVKDLPGRKEVVFQTYLKTKEQEARIFINQIIQGEKNKN